MKTLILTILTLCISTGTFAQTYTWGKFEATKDNKADDQFQFFPSGFGWYLQNYYGSKKLMYTNDGGETWAEKPRPYPGSYTLVLKKIYFTDSLHGFARFEKTYGSNNSYRLMKTEDGGLNWYMQNDTPLFPGFTGGNGKTLGVGHLKFLNAKVMYGHEVAKDSTGETCIVPYLSSDSGKTFINLYDNMYGGTSYYKTNDMEFVNESVGYAVVGGQGNYTDLMKTTDGGQNWTVVNQPGKTYYKLEVVTEDILYVTTTDILISTDGGSTFTSLDFDNNSLHFYGDTGWGKEITSTHVTNVFFYDEDHGIATFNSGSHGYFFARTTDGGSTWVQDDVDRSLFDISSTYPLEPICMTGPDSYYGIFRSYIITNTPGATFGGTSSSIIKQQAGAADGLGIFPNPATDIVYLNIPGFEPNDIYGLEVFNGAGQLVYRSEIREKNAQISLQGLGAKGLALVMIRKKGSTDCYDKKKKKKKKTR